MSRRQLNHQGWVGPLTHKTFVIMGYLLSLWTCFLNCEKTVKEVVDLIITGFFLIAKSYK